MPTKPRIIITTGDPEGIGLEVTKKALRDSFVKRLADYMIIKPSDSKGLDALDKALSILRNKNADALVTAPLSKYKIVSSGIPFSGHTEYLAHSTKTKKFAMMFFSGRLRVSLVTRHIPLKEVAKQISKKNIINTIELTVEALRKYFKIICPRIGVCGINPHCGESGSMGSEESKFLIPALKSLDLKAKIDMLPADAAFYKAYNKELDAVVSMYHDQALAPFKMIAFEKGVNATLGLPFVRTSPDHGTAYDIAKKKIANSASMKEAIKLAVRMFKGGIC